MGAVINMDEYRQQITITTLDGIELVVPVSYFVDVAKGFRFIYDLDDLDAILRVIVAEWLEHIGAVGYGYLREIADEVKP